MEIKTFIVMKLKTFSKFDNTQILGVEELKALVGGTTYCQCYYSYNYYDDNHQFRTQVVNLINSSNYTGSECLSACAYACNQDDLCGSENLEISFTTTGSGSGSMA